MTQINDHVEMQIKFDHDNVLHTINIRGKGKAILGSNVFSVEGTKNRSFSVGKSYFKIPLSSIYNVSQDGKKVFLEVHKKKNSGKVDIQGCVIILKDEQEAALLRSYLPEQTAKGIADEQEEFDSMLNAVTPRVYFTTILLAANVVYFIIMLVSGAGFFAPSIEKLISFGGNFGHLTLSGEYWRLLTSTFIHAGILHLFFNMMVLLSFGYILEKIYGNFHFILIYVISGVLASMASTAWNPSVVSIGASGAIFGLFGALGAAMIRQRQHIPPSVFQSIRKETIAFVVYNVLFGLAVPGIDNAAHLGGLAAGFFLGLAAMRSFSTQRRPKQSLVTLPATLALSLVIIIPFSLTLLSSQKTEFFRYQQVYAEREDVAISTHRSLHESLMQGDIDERAFVEKLDKKVLPVWESLLESGQSISTIPAQSKEDFVSLLDITKLRIDALSALIEGVKTNNEDKLQKSDKIHEKIADMIEQRENE